MSELREKGGPVDTHREDETARELDLVGYTALVWRYRWLVLSVVIAATFVTFVMTAMTPKAYESTATLLGPRETSGVGLLSGLAGSGLLQQMPGLSVPSLTPNRDMLVSILKSRTLAYAVVEQFRLQERYRARYLEEAAQRLEGLRKISVSREGVISVRTEDADPYIAAEIANFHVERLNRLVTAYGTGEAGRQRVFLTDQVARARADLDLAEDALRRFQERNRAIALQDQTRGAIEAAARVKGEIMASEVQLQAMRTFATESNPEVVALRRRVEEMKRHLTQLQYGDSAPTGRRDFIVPFPRVPEVGLELARLTREVKVQETLVTLLSQYLEQARIAEAKEGPVVMVLDRAVPAERPSRPRLRFNLTVAGAASLVVGLFLPLIVDYLRHARWGRQRPGLA